ncbi:uncharacterized protein LOC135157358 [Lytechinus pictus]|uniref:uncharacterized protein LOC135157358 n=1 Tax=Lytechinus pictus TaxID=7653 RepID=UPI0030BA0360
MSDAGQPRDAGESSTVREMRQEDDQDVQPGDSASQCGSHTSSASSSKLRLMARKAALAAEAAAMEERQNLELEEFRLTQRKLRLSMQTKLRIAEAEERVYLDFETNKFGVSLPEKEDETLPYPSDNMAMRTPENTVPRSSETAVARSSEAAVHTTTSKPVVASDSSWNNNGKGDKISANQSRNENSDLINLMRQSQKQQQHLLEAMQLPKAELTCYEGDPLGFWEFWRSFEDSVDATLVEDRTKLTRLLHYCKGEPKRLLSPCLLMPTMQGYSTAKHLLQERYGNPVIITEAWVKKITNGKSIGPQDRNALRALADDMSVCLMSFRAMGFEHELSPQKVLLPIAERLPYHLKGKWLNRVGVLRRQNRIPGFEDMMYFVQEAAQEINDPVYGGLMSSKSDQRKSTSGGKPKGSFSTSSSSKPAEPGCFECKGDHKLWDCKQFKDMMPKDRLRLARKKGLCFNCLRPGHMTGACKSKMTCSVEGCSRKHNKLLHTSEPAGDQNSEGDAQNNSVEVEASCNSTGAGRRSVLPIVPVRVRAEGGKQVLKTYALLDSGSTSTFCLTSLVRRLGVKGVKEKLLLTTLERKESIVHTEAVSLVVDTGDDSKRVKLPCVYTKDSINVKGIHMAKYEEIKGLTHLKGINIPLATEEEVGLIIGQDVPEALFPLEIRKGKEGPYAISTCLGWTLHGPLNTTEKKEKEIYATSTFIEGDLCLEKQLEKFWKLETADPLKEERGMSRNDVKALAEWEQGICTEDGHYQLPIPFKRRPPNLQNNRWLAQRRLESLGRKLNQSDGLLQKYADGITDLLEKGYAEEVNEQEENKNQCEWYLPHHAVFHPQKPGKVRIVFDCAAEWKGLSLNKVVYQGPDLTNKLIGVLLRFRSAPVALMADVEAMFHQVRVPAADRDVLRFLWWPRGNMKENPLTYRMCVHLFGGTWSPSVCSYALRRTAEDFETEFSPDVARIVKHNFYVDDCLVAVPDEDAAIRIATELRSLLQKKGFRLTKWISNRTKVLQSIPEEERAKQVKGLDLNREPLPVERALGINWDVQEDCLEYKTSIKDKPLTRRGLLSIVSSIYDPLGFLSPFILKAKHLMQRLTTLKLGWDDPIPDVEQEIWQQWVKQLSEVEHFKVPRCMIPTSYGAMIEYQLHHFADASEEAYGAVTYLVAKNSDGQVCSSLVFAKSHLAPLKRTTIPRLELMAATVAVKADVLVRRELGLPLKDSVFWTDSMIVLAYIKNEDKRFHTFVANRLSVIHSVSDVKQWHHVNSKENPADDVSRGMSARDLVASQRWIHGPEFILLSEEERSQDPDSDDISDNDPEVKTVKSFTAETRDEVPLAATDKLLNYFSEWYKLKKAVARILQFGKYLQSKAQKKTFDCEKLLTVSDLRDAEQAILKYIQHQSFPEELEVLQRPVRNERESKEQVSRVKKSSSLSKLDPKVFDDGLIHVGGRLQHASVDNKTKHPIILPKMHHVVRLIIRQYHQMSGHSGREHVLSLLRRQYWVISGRVAVKQALRDCVVCKRMSATPTTQKMADLPSDRVQTEKPPFTYVGVDCFGPFMVKQGRSHVKRYGCIFTCLVVRAVHIEILHSLETDSFINGLQRFIARRGQPEVIRSDNGTNFVGAERELRDGIRSWNQQKIQDHLLRKGIDWKFNPPSASHMGGSWERQIRTVRKVLNALLKQQALSDEGLCTLMCLVEAVINGRPLTVVSDDYRDLEPLTPNHLLLLRQSNVLPFDVSEKRDLYSQRRWRQIQYLADVFWRRWIREYLPALQQREKWSTPSRNIAVGDIVLIMDGLPRNQWLMGRITETFSGRDGLVRTAKIKTKSSTLVRPVQKLCLIESTEQEK